MQTLGLRDIIGPIMVGPSSSHTAGALATALMARALFGHQPARVRFTLYGSFAHTGSGHGTDKALVAGMLGLEPDDLAIRDSFTLAREANMEVEIIHDTAAVVDPNGSITHPNTVDITMSDLDGETLTVRGVSIGGGAAVITRINDIDVDITGEHTSIVVYQHDEPGVLAHIASCLARHSVNIATTRMYRTRKGARAFTIMEIDGDIAPEVGEDILSSAAISELRVIPAASSGKTQLADAEELAWAEENFEQLDFTSGSELLTLCSARGWSIARAMREREHALQAINGLKDATDSYLARVLDVMDASARGPLSAPEKSMGGLIGGEGKCLMESAQAAADGAALVDDLALKTASYAMAVLETNASMGRIVAAPTAGSAGTIPGVLLALRDCRGFSDDQLRDGLLTAAAVGYLVARNANVSGAQGGCQAEIGAAAGMAAAAAVEMAGGTPVQALDAAANVLTCLMGLVCDPVGGLVEVPCQKRNATAANTALVCAQIALSGIGNLYRFDETVEAMEQVGNTLPRELKETALGGIAACPSACAWCNEH